ncbi:FtsX-like permease family protein [Paenibacillus sp. GCM10023252]|uniref:FtsX-like permease family protein n=1 Tax=Paenibacillus sp. GCM10023252 TaxID=3252649 RepID=UPI003624686C
MIRLAAATLASRRTSFAGSFLAATLAIALMSACSLLMFSAINSNSDIPSVRFHGVDLSAAGDRNIYVQSDDETNRERVIGAPLLALDTIVKVEAIEGVQEVIADQSFNLGMYNKSGEAVSGIEGSPLIGHGWSSARLSRFELDGRAPASGDVVVEQNFAKSADLSIGDSVTIISRLITKEYRISGLAILPSGLSMSSQSTLFFANQDAASLAGTVQPTAIGIIATPGTNLAELADLIENATEQEVKVYTGSRRGLADFPSSSVNYTGAIAIFGTMGGITAFAAIFVIAGTVSYAVRQRLRELALLRTIGATTRQVKRMIAAETFILAISAILTGLPLGYLCSALLGDEFRRIGAVPPSFQIHYDALPFFIAAAIGLVVMQLSAAIASRTGARVAPTQALRETVQEASDMPIVKLIVGILTFGGGLAVLLFTPMKGGIGVGMGFIACSLLLSSAALLGSLLMKLIGSLIGIAIRAIGGVAGSIAVAGVTARATRMAGAAMPLALMIAINGTMLLNSSLLTDMISDQQASRSEGTTIVTAKGSNGLPMDIVSELSAGGRSLSGTVPTTVYMQQGDKPQNYAAQGLYQSGAQPPLDLKVTDGSLQSMGASSVAVSSELAERYDLNIGSTIKLWLPDTTHDSFRVIAVYDLSEGFGHFVLPYERIAAADPYGFLTTLYLEDQSRRTAMSEDVDRAPAITDGLKAQYPMLRIASSEEQDDRMNDAEQSAQQASLYLLMAISIGFMSIAVINTFAMAASDRTRELTDLRLAGATPGQLRRIMGWETTLVVTAGIFIGVLITQVVIGVFSQAQDGLWRWIIRPDLYIGLITGTMILGMLSGIVPASRLIKRSTPYH